MNPSNSKSPYARVVVMTLTFKSRANCLMEGSNSSSRNSPVKIEAFNCSLFCSYIGSPD
jgi:hypothetical protein